MSEGVLPPDLVLMVELRHSSFLINKLITSRYSIILCGTGGYGGYSSGGRLTKEKHCRLLHSAGIY
jgi:hypothetical protein